MYAARQSLGRGEGTTDNRFAQVVVVLKLVAVLLETGLVAGEVATGGILTVGRHHTVEGEARRLLANLYLGITLHQLLTEACHADDATPTERGNGKHIAALLEHLGEIVVHGSGYALVLLPAQVAQLADTGGQFILGSLKLLVKRLALGRELLLAVSNGQQAVHFAIEESVPVVARAVTAIVADVERLVATGSLSQFLGCELIRIVGAVCFPWIGLQLI